MSNFKLTDLLRTAAGKPRPYTSAIIVAAGSGERMGMLKQHIEICGVPAVVRAMLAFDGCEYIDEIIVVTHGDESAVYSGYAEKFGIKKLAATVEGADTRQRSAVRGFAKINPKSEFVAIHDAARCLVTEGIIATTVAAAHAAGAASAAYRVFDTIKEEDGGNIKATLPREKLWAAATPQVFRTDLYRAAAYTAAEANFVATDDNMLAERLGVPVRLVDCGRENMKITERMDVAIAEAIIKEREGHAE